MYREEEVVQVGMVCRQEKDSASLTWTDPVKLWMPCVKKIAIVGPQEGHAFEAGTHEGPPTNVFNIVCLLGIRGSWQQ